MKQVEQHTPGLIPPNAREFKHAVLCANNAKHCRAMAGAIRSRRTYVLGKSSSDYESAARRAEREVRIIADRALREARAAIAAATGSKTA